MAQDPRQKVWELCRTDVDAALEFAGKIESNWNRAQALSVVALHVSQKARFLKIVKEAFEAARENRQQNRIVSCAAWIIHALTKRDDVDALPFVEELLDIIKSEPNPVRRADALLLIYEAVYSRKELRDVVLNPLLWACQEMNSWKRPRILSDVALVAAVDDLPFANKVIEMISDGSKKRQTLKMIEKGEWLGAHEFFPYFAKP
ncbi:MAG: hypothetical protein H7Z37_13755 [Pyrinomonadaceae bacterium]|nr:hypothetical protein [Pyrinomonadaceae bacterium]